MFVQGQKQSEYEELLTGTYLVLEKLLTEKTRIWEELRTAKRKTLKQMLSLNTRSAGAPGASSKTADANTERDGSSSARDVNVERYSSVLGGSGEAKRTVVFAVAYKTYTAQARLDRKNRRYFVWHITDLRGTCGVLINYDPKTVPSVAAVGELWALLDPSVLSDQYGDSKKEKEPELQQLTHTSRLVLAAHHVLRIGTVSGFRLCTSLSQSGGVCGMPFDANVTPDNTTLSTFGAKTFCPRHNVTATTTLTKNERHNLEADGIFFAEFPNQSVTAPIRVVSRMSQMCVQTMNGTRIKITRKRALSETSSPARLPQELVRAELQRRKKQYTERVIDPHIRVSDPEETAEEQAPKMLAPTPVMAAPEASTDALRAFVDDFLKTLNKPAAAFASSAAPASLGSFFRQTRNLDRRALHLAQRLRNFQLSDQIIPSDEYILKSIQQLLQLIKTLELNIKTSGFQEATLAQLEPSIFLLKRRLNATLSRFHSPLQKL